MGMFESDKADLDLLLFAFLYFQLYSGIQYECMCKLNLLCAGVVEQLLKDLILISYFKFSFRWFNAWCSILAMATSCLQLYNVMQVQKTSLFDCEEDMGMKGFWPFREPQKEVQRDSFTVFLKPRSQSLVVQAFDRSQGHLQKKTQ